MVKSRSQDPREAGAKPPFSEQTQAFPGREQDMSPRPDHGETSYRGAGRLKDRRALITGGDSGIGRAVALAFAREGAHVAFSYVQGEEQDAAETVRLVREAERQAHSIAANVGSEADCKRLVAEAVEHLGGIDILVNNAAKQGKAVERFEDLDPARIEETFRVNIIGMFLLVRSVLPGMQRGSSIINVASIQSYKPSAEILDYAATKGAIVTFTKGLAQSLITRGIRVNCVAPGPVWTPLVVQSFPAEKNAKFGQDSPMERPAQPAEIAPAFVFLASREASYVNGEILGVTGGKPLP